jgi:hypothetical protein
MHTLVRINKYAYTYMHMHIFIYTQSTYRTTTGFVSTVIVEVVGFIPALPSHSLTAEGPTQFRGEHTSKSKIYQHCAELRFDPAQLAFPTETPLMCRFQMKPAQIGLC